MEATWSIFPFLTQHISYSAKSLPLHEFGVQKVVFQDVHKDEGLENARRGESNPEAFFLLNRKNPPARHLLYTDIVGDYT